MKKYISSILAAALLLISPAAVATEQSSIVTPVAGPMNMATFAGTYLNPALRAIQACNWGPSAPANGAGGVPLAYQHWCDTTTNPVLVKMYDGTSWVTIGSLNTSTHAYLPYLTNGVSGGIPYFSATSVMGSSAVLAANNLMIGGGAGTAPSTTTTGTGVVTALGINPGTAGSFVVNGGALGSPSSAGTIPAFTLGGTISGGGNNINNVIIGASTPLAGTFTTATANSFIPNLSTIPTNGMYLPAANTLGWGINSAAELQLTGTALSPAVDGGSSLGTATLGWQNMFGNTGFVFNIENGDWVATHTTGILTVGTGDFRVTTAGTNSASAVTVGGTQTLTNKTLSSPAISGPATITSNSASALAVGPNGTTNPTLKVDGSVASEATGVEIVGGAAGAASIIRAISSATNENFALDAKGSGSLLLSPNSTGNVNVYRPLAMGISTLVAGQQIWSNMTSGSITINPVTGALGSGVATLPTGTYTFVGDSLTQTLTNKTLNCANNTCTVRIGSDVSGLGTGIATALAVNTGSAGAPVLFNGALGTPTSGTLTSATGLPISTGVSGLGTGVATALATPSSSNLRSAITDETGTGFAMFNAAPQVTGLLDVNGAIKYSTQSAPAQITSNQNDYNPSSVNCSTSTTLLINSDASRDITGLAGGVTGCEMRLINNGSFTITLKEESGSSTAANRFSSGADIALAVNTSVPLIYDGTASRWRLAQLAPAAGAGTGTVTSVATGSGLTGGTITTSGTLSLATIATGNMLANASGSTAAPTATKLPYIARATATFTTDATSTTSTVYSFVLTAGGGGGGGSSATSVAAAGGGGAGGTCIGTFSGVAASTSVTITVGGGGAGGTSGNSGTVGSNSTIAATGITTITATGGGGAGNASASVSSGGSSGTCSTGTGVKSVVGGPGGTSVGGIAGSNGTGGHGGNSYWGGGGGGAQAGLSTTGGTGSFGSGGGGGASASGTGGAGTAGTAEVTWISVQ